MYCTNKCKYWKQYIRTLLLGSGYSKSKICCRQTSILFIYYNVFLFFSEVSACYSRFVDQLRTGHRPVCPWGNCPSPGKNGINLRIACDQDRLIVWKSLRILCRSRTELLVWLKYFSVVQNKISYSFGFFFVSEYFAEIHLSNSSEAVNLFRERCLQIVKVNQNLPVLKKRTLNEMVSMGIRN